MSYRLHQNCRACGYGPPLNANDIKSDSKEKLASVLDLGFMPLPNAFRAANQSRPGHYPLELLACPRCHLGQLSAVVDPLVMYSDYPYVTSPSQTMSHHIDSLWETLTDQKKIETVVEIGSNDGLLLERFRDLGATRVWGIDPAKNLAEVAIASRRVPTLASLFNREAANKVAANLGNEIDLVLARHVFCHVDDWRGFIDDLAVLCGKETLVCIEVPYAHDTIAQHEWDTVYAEHLSYLTIRSMGYLLNGSAFKLSRIVRFPIHGGAIALILRRTDSEAEPDGSVMKFLTDEQCGLSDWERFGAHALKQITDLVTLVSELRDQGKRVVGYGASAKCTMWINACEFSKRDIEAVYDYTPQKWYTTIPGTNIPVRNEGAFYADAADYAIVWAWNFLDEILQRHGKWIRGGGQFIVPVPEVKIL